MRAFQNLRTVADALIRPIRRVIPSGYTHRCLVMLMVIGPLFSVAGWYHHQRVDDILQRGLTAEAIVTGTKVARGKGGPSYSIDLAWRDARGAQHRVDEMFVSAQYFSQVTRISPPQKVWIRFLADRETTRRTVALPDDHSRNSSHKSVIPYGLVGGLFGLAGAVLIMVWRNRRLRRAALIASSQAPSAAI